MQNIIIVGESGVGKSSYLSRLVNDCFYESYMSTISKETHKVQYNDKEYIIHDTSGNSRFEYLFKEYYKHANGALIFYSTHVSSAYKWIRKVREENKDIPIVIVATKRDEVKSVIPEFEYPCVGISSKLGDIDSVLSTIIPLLTPVKVSKDSWVEYFFSCYLQ